MNEDIIFERRTEIVRDVLKKPEKSQQLVPFQSLGRNARNQAPWDEGAANAPHRCLAKFIDPWTLEFKSEVKITHEIFMVTLMLKGKKGKCPLNLS